jgi:Asp-tRNA(Asn)/Glu-tRNA(Gln) amidotransferase A subunit family amidase
MFDQAWRRYRESEPVIKAWVEVNPQPPTGAGPLDGVPFGVKDIFETAGLATEYGSAIYAGRKGEADAEVVTQLRRLGGILFGKTTTAAFASFDPPATRNPRNPEHTPGGSSSGSAAAVAAGVVPLALGTQTLGSVIRPASFCGIVGFKPTFGAASTDGVLTFAPSLDTVGFFTRDVEMMENVWRALGFGLASAGRLRFGVVAGLPSVSSEMDEVFGHELDRIRAQRGVEVIALQRTYTELLDAVRVVNDYEGARSHVERLAQFRDRIGRKLAELVRRGLEIPELRYREAANLLAGARVEMDSVMRTVDVLLSPAALGVAPRGIESTGDPAMNAVWTGLHMPVVSVPMPRRANELPLGLQVVAACGKDGMLLSAARWYEHLSETR